MELGNKPAYGNLKRINWVVTDWYRSNAYYAASSWRGTWAKDGGGTLLNQCPHNLDMICWLFGCPRHVVATCHEGKYHPIEVEDDVTAYMQWANGATGVFVASTGEACGVNRLEIAMDNALIVSEDGRIVVKELDRPEIEYRLEEGDGFTRPTTTTKEFKCEAPEGAYEKILTNFANDTDLIAKGEEAINSLYLANAIYLSSWLNSRVDIPVNKAEEKVFEDAFEKVLKRKVRGK
ncbi:MAG: Gfo/Idh/MocA family oxidoreductase [Bacteroidaceae bacterium]|nr:Gfo/Idh/MocA family oxidoreductase [Bacteroidaceae bacterium]